MMQLLFLPIQVAAFLFLPAIICGNADGNSNILSQKHGRELKRGYFLCETSTSTTFCLKKKQLCDVSTGRARCICEDGWKGSRCEELIDESLSVLPTRMPTFPRVGGTCTESTDCVEANSNCLEGLCRCDSGYYSRKGKCVNIDECKDLSNGCDKNSECNDTDGSYQCHCKDGFLDTKPNFPGTNCRQTNECNLGMHDCDEATQVCVDRRPPKKWECIQKTPAPSPKPTPKPTPMPNPTPKIQTVICDSPFNSEIIVTDEKCQCIFTDEITKPLEILKELEAGFCKFIDGATPMSIVRRSICIDGLSCIS